ncbi:ABC transporter substrate-binding protein [Gemmiger sp. An120]|uniref:peptide ABC transporter substrate-binding protein n=1 Tax=Gemmiger TaxID=204475 RepID=UPI000B381317|nr:MULTISPECIES: peptide ABC transporter substrate-binding protein [Gemmiger]MBM6915507.1 peptide ABC transporter substrate-binding protein [Gemmiger formicilis]OUQ40724.1 ABC transporter substrate-binding protein [Gemmiger sp. An120]
MNLWKRMGAAALAGALALSLVACGGGNTSSAGSTAGGSSTGGEATGSNVLNVMVEVEVASLDPQLATDGTSFEVIADFTDGLMQMDAEGQAVEALAESYEVSEDGCTYTFHIREDANWSNGDPVTANDFVFAWQRAADPATASEYSYMMSDIGQIKNAAEIIAGEKDKSELGVTAVDEKTLKVELNVPVPYFLSLMYFPTFYPVNQAFYESLAEGTFGTSPETVLSNGAFILESYEPAALSFSLVKNPDYYNADSIQLDGLNYQVVKDSQQAFMSYQNGDLDIVKLSGDQVDQVQGDPELSVHGAGYLWYLTLNQAEVPALANQNMRLALTHAIDRVSIVEDVVKDGSLATYTAVPPQFATGPDGSDFSADQEMFKDVCSDDPAKAAEYFEAAKEELGQDTFTFELLVEDTTESQNVAAVIQEQIQTNLPGVTVNITVEPKKQRVEDIQEGNYEVCLTRWGPDYADPMTYLNMWITDNNNNYGKWSNPEYDQIIADCTTGQYVGDAEARWAALYDAEKIIMDEAVIVPVYTKADANMIKSNVSGIEFHPVALNRVFKNATKG